MQIHFYLHLFLAQKPKTSIKFSAIWWSGKEKYFCFLLKAAELQSHAELNRTLRNTRKYFFHTLKELFILQRWTLLVTYFSLKLLNYYLKYALTFASYCLSKTLDKSIIITLILIYCLAWFSKIWSSLLESSEYCNFS